MQLRQPARLIYERRQLRDGIFWACAISILIFFSATAEHKFLWAVALGALSIAILLWHKISLRLNRVSSELQLHVETDIQVAQEKKLPQRYEIILQTALDLLRAKASALYLTNEAGDALELVATCGNKELLPSPGFCLELGEGLKGRVASSAKPYIVTDYPKSSYWLPEPETKTHALLAAPLLVGQRAVGVLEISDDRARRFNREDLSVVERLARRATVIIHDAQLRLEVEKQKDEIQETRDYLSIVLEYLKDQQNLALIGLVYGEDIHFARNKLGLAKVAARNILDATKKESVAAGQARRILDSIDDYLNVMDRTQAATVRYPKPERISLHEILDSLVLSKRIPAGIKVAREYRLADPIVSAPSAQLRQVFHVLLQNALDAMGSQGLLTLRTCSANASEANVAVSVSDTGKGIPREKLTTSCQSKAGMGTTMSVVLPRECSHLAIWLGQHEGKRGSY